MAKIKTDETHLKRQMKIKWRRFDALLIPSARRGFVSTIDLRSKGHDLTITIRNRAFHESR